MLKIGDFSKLSRISIRMLRHYDAIRLLVPERVDGCTGYRQYSEAQLPLANRINALRDMGFGLSAIAEILPSCGDAKSLRQHLEAMRGEMEYQMAETRRRLLLLETALTRLGKDGTAMEYNVTRKVLPQRYVASVRGIIPAYDREGDLWTTLMRETESLHLQNGNPCYTLAIFYDEGFKEKDVDVEVQKSVAGEYPDTEHVRFKTVPPVEIASATYQGSYECITEVNMAVANWVRDNGYEIDGLSFCIYHVSPHESSNPEDWVTEVCYPIRKR